LVKHLRAVRGQREAGRGGGGGQQNSKYNTAAR